MKLQELLLTTYLSGKNKINDIHRKSLEMAKCQAGASTVEYALLIAVIVFGVVGAAAFMIPELKTMFTDIVKKIADLAAG